MFGLPKLTRNRIRFAYVVALGADILQIALGPLGWAFIDEIIDVIAALGTIAALGFHPLLLPTFAIEFLPVVDLLPTWTGCVAWLVWLRKKQQAGTAVRLHPTPEQVKARYQR